jgi:Tol biopolymer transport system component
VVYLDDADSDGLEELWSASLYGGDPIRLSGTMIPGDSVADFEIASDGTFVALLATYFPDSAQLYTVPIAGGTPVRRSHDLDPGAYVASFEVSPDAQWLLYVAETDPDQFDLFRVAASGGAATAYTYTNSTICIQDVDSFEISPDSTIVAFRTSLNCTGEIRPNRNLYRVPLTAVSATLVASSYDGGFVGRYDFTRPAPGGTPVLTFLFDLDGPLGYLNTNKPVELQWSKGGTFGNDHVISGTMVDGGNVTSFAVVPGGQQVVFRADREVDEGHELFLTTAGVNGAVQIPVQIHENFFATWVRELYAVSPAGDRVVFAVDDNPISAVDYERLRSSALAAPGSSVLLSEPTAGGGTFRRLEVSADSQRAVYMVDRDELERVDLFSSPIAGGAAARLNPGGNTLLTNWDVLDFALSPDGSTVQFVHDSETFMSGAHTSQIRSSPVAGGGSVLLGPSIDRNTSEGFLDLWAPLRSDWVVALGDSGSPGVRTLTLSDGCLLCDGFEGTGDGRIIGVDARDGRIRWERFVGLGPLARLRRNHDGRRLVDGYHYASYGIGSQQLT